MYYVRYVRMGLVWCTKFSTPTTPPSFCEAKMTKKRKGTDGLPSDGSQRGDIAHGDASKSQKLEKDHVDHSGTEHTPLTLDEIKASIKRLSLSIPTIPVGGMNDKDLETLNEWALVSAAAA